MQITELVESRSLIMRAIRLYYYVPHIARIVNYKCVGGLDGNQLRAIYYRPLEKFMLCKQKYYKSIMKLVS